MSEIAQVVGSTANELDHDVIMLAAHQQFRIARKVTEANVNYDREKAQYDAKLKKYHDKLEEFPDKMKAYEINLPVWQAWEVDKSQEECRQK